MKKLIILFISLICIDVNALDLAPNAKSAILIENSTGKVLYEKNADEALPPASMTKMMTLLLAFENIENGTMKMSDKLSVSKNAENMGGSQVFLEEGASYTLEDLIKSIAIASANDSAVVLAEAIGGNTSNFVKMMNDEGKKIGLTATNFVNPYGLDAKGHLSSARDMSKIARELLKHEDILKYSSMYEDHLNKKDGTSIWMVNTNKLIRIYSGIDGLKTGFTDNAGYCVTATGSWNDLRLIAVVMGEKDSDSRNKDIISMFNYAKNNYKFRSILSKDKSLSKTDYFLTSKNTDYYVKDDISMLYKSNQKVGKYTYKVKLYKKKLPLKKGSNIGKITIYKDGKYEKKADVVIKDDIDKLPINRVLIKIAELLITGNYH